MPFFQEATFHDRQATGSTTPQSTSSTTFIDITGATITTKNLGEPGNYAASTSLLVSNTNNNSTISIRATLDGVPVGVPATIKIRTKDLDIGYTLLTTISGIESGKVIQLQMATDIGTLTLSEYAISVDGVPDSRVV